MDRYETLRVLGKGAFGIAELVREKEPKAGRTCVIKKIDLAQRNLNTDWAWVGW